jgi:hypothetical protein
MSEENSGYQQNTPQALPVDPPLVTDAKSTDVGAQSQPARRTPYSELTGLELMHSPWIQV